MTRQRASELRAMLWIGGVALANVLIGIGMRWQ